MDKKISLVFAREEGMHIDVGVVIECTLDHPEKFNNQYDVLRRLNAAVTQWVNTTDEGRACYDYSSEDLNIGDLLSSVDFNKKDDPLIKILREHGMHLNVLAQFGGHEIIAYDRHLVDGEDLIKEGPGNEGATPGTKKKP